MSAGLAVLPLLGTQEIWILLVIGILLFSRDLTGISRRLAKAITAFWHGLRALENDWPTFFNRSRSKGGPAEHGRLPAEPSHPFR